MKTECKPRVYEFQGVGQRSVVGQFNGGVITSDGGGLLLREVEQRRGIIRQFAQCFHDEREARQVEHSVQELVAQRVYGLALGYEDLNDHDELRRDPLLAVLVGKEDPTGQGRKRARDRGTPLAGKSTLNRLELYPVEAGAGDRYKKIRIDIEAMDRLFVELVVQTFDQPPEQIVLDLDATDDALQGDQEGRFFHGYYKESCYLPLYIFCGHSLLCARLRSANIDASAGTVEELDRIVGQIRQPWPQVKILIRADSGFAREEIMAWCESQDVDYVLGLAKNNRLLKAIEPEGALARQPYDETGQSARVYTGFSYQTLQSWSRPRRVVAKAEHLAKGANPRFVVTSLSPDQSDAQQVYEQTYCARGEMENRIKEQQLCLFADRTSCSAMRANQVRLWFSSVAYILLQELRRVGLAGSQWARAQCDTIRLKLLKIGAQVRISVRRILVAFSSAYPYDRLFAHAYDALCRDGPSP